MATLPGLFFLLFFFLLCSVFLHLYLYCSVVFSYLYSSCFCIYTIVFFLICVMLSPLVLFLEPLLELGYFAFFYNKIGGCNNMTSVSKQMKYNEGSKEVTTTWYPWRHMLLLTRKLLNQGFLLVSLSHHFEVLRSPPCLGWPWWYICVTNDHGYVPHVAKTSQYFLHSWIITGIFN